MSVEIDTNFSISLCHLHTNLREINKYVKKTKKVLQNIACHFVSIEFDSVQCL